MIEPAPEEQFLSDLKDHPYANDFQGTIKSLEKMIEKQKKLCHNCEHLSDRHHELDPLGEWKWCELWKKDVLEDTYSCDQWVEVELI